MIRVIAICVFRRGDQILVTECFDSVKKEKFARPLGGGVEVGETTQKAIRRELQEEIAADIADLRLLGVMENLFSYEGQNEHEIVFVYEASFVDKRFYDMHEIEMLELGWASPAIWKKLDSFGPECRLVPDGLQQLLGTH